MSLTGSAGVAMLTLYEFFQGGVFPLIFAITLRGLGSHTKDGAVLLTTAICGGAIFPVIMWPVASAKGANYSFCVVVAVTVGVLLFPLYLLLVPKAQKQVDPVVERRSTRKQREKDGVLPTLTPQTDEKRRSHVERALCVSGKRKGSSGPNAEHAERRERKGEEGQSMKTDPLLPI